MPASRPIDTMPTSMASPPVVVTMRAVIAAARLARRDESKPISRYEKTVVSSQYTYSSTRSSAVTSPSIAPAKAVSSPRTRTGVRLKYQRQ